MSDVKKHQGPPPQQKMMKVEERYVRCPQCDGLRQLSDGEPCTQCASTGRVFAEIIYRYESPMPTVPPVKP